MSDVEISPGTEISAPPTSSETTTVTNFSKEGIPSKGDVPPPPVAAKSDTKLAGLKKTAKADSSPATDAASAPVVPNPYTPNFKMKVDKEEKEIDEFYRGLIKDKESEEKVRATMQKAAAFESQTQRYEKLKQDHEGVSTRYNGIDKSLKQLSKNLNEDDMESFCQTLKIDDAKILRYAQKILQKLEMDPNQRAEAERIRNDRLRASQYEEQSQELAQSLHQEQARNGLMQTEMLLSKPEYAQVALAFDNQIKRPGAFLEEVCKQGILHERQNGIVLSPEQAVNEALKVWGPFLAGQSQPQPAAPAAALPSQPRAPVTPPPVIPHVAGRASSPIKQSVNSIADLKKLRDQHKQIS